MATIVHGRRKAVDLAEVNGRIFVNNSGVGLYPDMVRFRDQTQARTGHSKRAAMLSASLRARCARSGAAASGSETEEFDAPVRTPLLFVGNNRYQVNLFALGRREAIDQGELCVYAVRARNRAHLFWAGIRGIFGRLDQQRDFITALVKEVEISANRAALTLSAGRRDADPGDALALSNPARRADPHRAGTAEAAARLDRDEAVGGDAVGALQRLEPLPGLIDRLEGELEGAPVDAERPRRVQRSRRSPSPPRD